MFSAMEKHFFYVFILSILYLSSLYISKLMFKKCFINMCDNDDEYSLKKFMKETGACIYIIVPLLNTISIFALFIVLTVQRKERK